MRIDMRRLAFDGLQASDTHTLGIYCGIATTNKSTPSGEALDGTFHHSC